MLDRADNDTASGIPDDNNLFGFLRHGDGAPCHGRVGPGERRGKFGVGYFMGLVGAPVSAIVGAFISARLTCGILDKVSDFKSSMTGVLGAGFMASILAVIGYFTLDWSLFRYQFY